jgi:hypothetical protein
MSNIVSLFKNTGIAFKNLAKDIADKNKLFVIVILLLLFGLVYLAIVSSSLTIWILAIFSVFLCLASYFKSKSLTDAALTLTVGLFTVFTVQWTNEYALVVLISILILLLISFMGSSISLHAKIESIITVAAGYLQNGRDHKQNYDLLYGLSRIQTKHQQIGIEDRALIIKELIFIKVPTIELRSCIEVIEGFKTVLGFNIDDAIKYFCLMTNIFMIQKNRCFNIDDMELLFTIILICPLSPGDFFIVINNTKDKLIKKEMEYEKYISKLSILSKEYRDKDIIESALTAS